MSEDLFEEDRVNSKDSIIFYPYDQSFDPCSLKLLDSQLEEGVESIN